MLELFCMETGCVDIPLERIKHDIGFGLLDLTNLEDPNSNDAIQGSKGLFDISSLTG